MLGVIENSKDKIVFSKEELDDLINRVADEAVDETMEQKRLEIAAAIEEEKRPGVFSRFFKKR